jgi:hypothetical protein
VAVSYWDNGGAVDVPDSSAKNITTMRKAYGLKSLFVSEVPAASNVICYELLPGNYSVRKLLCCIDGQCRSHKTFAVQDRDKSFMERLATGHMPNDKRIGAGYFTVKPNEGGSGVSLDAGSAPIQGPSPAVQWGPASAALKTRPFNNEEI